MFNYLTTYMTQNKIYKQLSIEQDAKYVHTEHQKYKNWQTWPKTPDSMV